MLIKRAIAEEKLRNVVERGKHFEDEGQAAAGRWTG